MFKMIIGPYKRAKIRRKTVPYERHVSSEISPDLVKTLLIFPRINGPYVCLKFGQCLIKSQLLPDLITGQIKYYLHLKVCIVRALKGIKSSGKV